MQRTLMQRVYNVPRAIIGDCLHNDKHRPDGVFRGKFLDDPDRKAIIEGYNEEIDIDIVVNTAHLEKRHTVTRVDFFNEVKGVGFILNPSVGKIFATDADMRVVDFYKYLPLLCVNIRIRSFEHSPEIPARERDDMHSKVTVFGSVLSVEIFKTLDELMRISQAFRDHSCCVIRIKTFAYALAGMQLSQTRYICSDLITENKYDKLNGQADFYFDNETSSLGYSATQPGAISYVLREEIDARPDKR
jgi:hypothetical protein